MWPGRLKPLVPPRVLSLRRGQVLETTLWARHLSPHSPCPKREDSSHKCPVRPPCTTQPTHNEDGDKAGQGGVPVSIAGGRRLAHQDTVEDEVSQAQLYSPYMEKRKRPLSNPTDGKPQPEAGKNKTKTGSGGLGH